MTAVGHSASDRAAHRQSQASSPRIGDHARVRRERPRALCHASRVMSSLVVYSHERDDRIVGFTRASQAHEGEERIAPREDIALVTFF